ncbi:unnamed protein product [Alopecurus aequalis]
MAGASDNQRRVSAHVAPATDMISALPDDVLLLVLSKLSSREAVHTCFLAQRWRDLWRSVPIINVSFEDFEDRPAEDDVEREAMFKKFVNRLLMLRNPVSLDEFRLVYNSSTDDDDASDDANDWISHASEHNARYVKVVDQCEPLELDTEVFASSYLKRLHIASANLDPDFFHDLQTGCPALEYLFLCDCFIQDVENFINTLKVLVLSLEVVFVDHASISAPSLISLSIVGDFRGRMLPKLHDMASLETASINLWGNILACDADAIRHLLGSLSHVTSLEFFYEANKLTMENNFRWCPTFTNLINLTLDAWCVHAEFYGLVVFLQKSPNLKKLTLKLYQGDVVAITGELEDRSFTCEQLEIVEIICSETSQLLPRVTQFLGDSGITPDKLHLSH